MSRVRALALLIIAIIAVVLFVQYENDRSGNEQVQNSNLVYDQQLRQGEIAGCPLLPQPLYTNGTDCPDR